MSRTRSLTVSDLPLLDFTILHEIMRDHLRRGNNFAVLGTLALDVVHENSIFWKTCTYHDGIAAATISLSMKNRERGAHRHREVSLRTSDASSKVDGEPLTSNELYIMLRRITGDDLLLHRVMDQLEEDPFLSNKSSGDGGGDDVNAISPVVETRVALDEVCALLREHCGGGEIRQGNSVQTPAMATAVSPGPLKHGRESDSPLKHRVARRAEPTAEANMNKRCSSDPDETQEAVCTDALEVLARMSALPGSTRAVTSFDTMADSLDRDDSEGRTGILRRSLGRYSNVVMPVTAPTRPVVTMATRPRQRRHKFTPEEDEAILQGVARFTKGPRKFESILYAYRGVWHPERTAEQLRDHWRAILRPRAVLQDGGYRGKDSVARRGGNSAGN